MCSPSPINFTFASVAEQADKAPPPFAVPSNLVNITPEIPTACLKVVACLNAVCPISPDITNNDSSG